MTSPYKTLLQLSNLQALEEHTDEVWHIQFSHRGDRLASASKDLTAIVWSVRPDGEARLLLRLAGHPLPVTHLSWSPDDSKLLTCSGHQVCRPPSPFRCQKCTT